MLCEPYLFLSKQTTKYPYLYFEIPFNNTNRTLVHVIDHVHAQRLEGLSFIDHVHCETFSGTNTYAIEMQFNRELTREIIEELNEVLWQRPLSKDEVSAAKATTQLEGMRNFYKRKNMFAQLNDHNVSSEPELLNLYESITTIPLAKLEEVWRGMIREPKIIIAHVQRNISLKQNLDLLLGNKTTDLKYEEGVNMPNLIVDGKINDSDFVHVELVYKVPLRDMVEYQKATILFNLFQEVTYRQLFQRGLVYDFSLLVNEVAGEVTNMIFEFDSFYRDIREVKALVAKALSTPLEKLDVDDRVVREILEEAREQMGVWHESELERDFNHAWQIIVFGEQNYRKPETVESFLNEVTLQKIQQYRIKLAELTPSHVVVVKY